MSNNLDRSENDLVVIKEIEGYEMPFPEKQFQLFEEESDNDDEDSKETESNCDSDNNLMYYYVYFSDCIQSKENKRHFSICYSLSSNKKRRPQISSHSSQKSPTKTLFEIKGAQALFAEKYGTQHQSSLGTHYSNNSLFSNRKKMLQYNNLFFNFQKHGVQWNHEKDLQNISRSYCNN